MSFPTDIVAFGPMVRPKEELDAFHRLVRDLNHHLGPSSGLDSAEVEIQDLKNIMQEYSSNSSEWKRYAFGDPSQALTRNLVDRGNEKSNLVGSE